MSDQLRERVVAAVGDQYDIESEIGRGGMSIVYRALDRRLRRHVAIKVLPPEFAFDPAVRERFRREAQTAAQLNHPNIVPIHSVDEKEGIAYFAMTLCDGESLAQQLARRARPPVDEVRRVICEVADALAFAHLRGVVHRDIKPDNILLDRETGRALVTDFGIARAAEAGSRLTVTGIAVGTPAYMSPEQALGEHEIDGRSDIYSLGVVAYQMVTGRVPFTAGNSMALLMKQVTERPRPIEELRPDAPKALRDAIERALMKSPEDRWPTAASLRDAVMSDRSPGVAWRAEPREPVRYTSPRRGSSAVAGRAGVVTPRRAGSAIVLEQEHLASLTPAQRDDLRLWHGRVHLRDRIDAMRGYALLTTATLVAGLTTMVLGIDEGVPPAILALIVPGYMTVKLWRRGRSLREAGLRLRRVLLMPRARWVLPAPPRSATEQQLEKLAPREILEGPQGAAIRRAAEDRAAILDIVANLPKPDRALLPELAPTVNALVERVAHLALALSRLEQSTDPRQIQELGARIAIEEGESQSPDGERRLALLRRQRDTLEQIVEHRAALARQLESAGLALGNLRLDLIKLRSSGLPSALSDVTSATQEARALSQDIGAALDAVAEVRSL